MTTLAFDESPAPSYSSTTFQEVWHQWKDALERESFLSIESLRLHNLERDAEEKNDKVSALKDSSSKLFDKIKSPSSTEDFFSKFKSDSKRKSAQAAHVTAQHAFETSHQELSIAQDLAEDAETLMRSQSLKVKDLKKYRLNVNQCFQNLCLASQSTLPKVDTTAKCRELETTVMAAEAAVDSNQRLELDAREATNLIQRSEQGFKQASTIFNEVSNTPVDWTIMAGIGENDYDQVTNLATAAKKNAAIALNLLGPHVDIMPEPFKKDYTALLGLGLFQITNVTASLAGNVDLYNMDFIYFNMPFSNSVVAKEMSENQDRALGLLRNLRLWAQDTSNSCGNMQEQLKQLLRQAQVDMADYLHATWVTSAAVG